MLGKKKVLITAGPTYEPIDPVRFIGNRSTGKMGLALTQTFLQEGCEVVLILGPVSIQPVYHKDLKIVNIETAAQMFEASRKYFDWYDIAIFAAAVADYTPEKIAEKKIKKVGNTLEITLVKTKDILFEAGKVKKSNQFLAGFALETDDEISNAKEKIVKKNLDMVVLNSLNDAGAGFKVDTNKITILEKSNKLIKFELKSKELVALDIVNHIKKIIS